MPSDHNCSNRDVISVSKYLHRCIYLLLIGEDNKALFVPQRKMYSSKRRKDEKRTKSKPVHTG